jgi:methylated-DNA-protein-cysteine methyltransferase-like protein
MPPADPTASHARIHAVVRRIPRGRVATYGQVAELAGLPGAARLVGYALAALGPESRVPWQRVVNARGTVSPRSEPWAELEQRRRLEREGVHFGRDGRIDLARHAWQAGEAGAQRAQARRARSEAKPSEAGARKAGERRRAPAMPARRAVRTRRPAR